MNQANLNEVYQFDSYRIGPILRSLREDKGFSVFDVSSRVQISISSLRQLEQGGRRLTMPNLFLLMELYEVDANTILGIRPQSEELSIDARLRQLPRERQEELRNTFLSFIQMCA